jgi:hypothetical protein
MTEAKCDQRIDDLFTKGSHHRNLSIVYLTQNLFPQGKACRDIALNTQYPVLFNNPIDRQQVATLARRIYPASHAIFMKQFEQAAAHPYGHLVIDLKSSTREHDRLRSNIFDTNKRIDEERETNQDMSDMEDETGSTISSASENSLNDERSLIGRKRSYPMTMTMTMTMFLFDNGHRPITS